MNNLQIFKNDIFEVAVKLENGEWVFDAERVAKSLGLTGVSTKSGGKYEWVRWDRVNEYLKSLAKSGEIKKGDFIPEPAVYKLAFKASNEIAEKFQDWLAIEVLPTIRKTGIYSNKPACIEDVLIQSLQEMKNMRLQIREAREQTAAVKEEIRAIKDAIVINPKAEWRRETNRILNTISKNLGNKYKEVKEEVYAALKQRGNCRPNILINNLRDRAIKNGMTPSKADDLNILDVLENEPRLREIYITIVKEIAVKHGVKTI